MLIIHDVSEVARCSQGKYIDSNALNRLCDKNLKPEDMVELGVGSLSLPKTILSTPFFTFCMNSHFASRVTLVNASHMNKNEAWIEIKKIFLKYFLPENYQRLNDASCAISALKEKIIKLEKCFESLLLSLNE
jgi:hypothetical protein